MKITITLLCVWATLFLAGCDVKDPIYNTPHPDKGAIVITADWTQRGEGIATPSEYTTEAAGASFTLHEPVWRQWTMTRTTPGCNTLNREYY